MVGDHWVKGVGFFLFSSVGGTAQTTVDETTQTVANSHGQKRWAGIFTVQLDTTYVVHVSLNSVGLRLQACDPRSQPDRHLLQKFRSIAVLNHAWQPMPKYG